MPIAIVPGIHDMPRRVMIFIDGENMVFRYQDMLEKGFKPNNEIEYEKDVFVWLKNSIHEGSNHTVLRATYYTYATGDDTFIKTISDRIKQVPFTLTPNSGLPKTLYPCVFKKNRKGAKGKGVDIQMTVDILNHVHNNNIDIVYLVSGDGDYLPVINEIIRSGKQVYLASFSSGLNDELKNKVDKYIDLDTFYFQKQ